MPFVYTLASISLAASFTTSATPNTEIEHIFVKPGTRNTLIGGMYVGGKGAALTALSGIAYRMKKWFTTAAAGGTAQATVPPTDIGMQAIKATNGMSAAASVTAGTGGPLFWGGCTSGGAGPGGWVAKDQDSKRALEGGSNTSWGLWSASGTASMAFEANVEVEE